MENMMSEPVHHHQHSEGFQVIEEIPGRPYDAQPPRLWKELLTIFVFLAGIVLIATLMSYGMAWLINLG